MDQIKPDGYMKDGTSVYFVIARGCSKSNIQLEMYGKLLGISDKEWEEMKRESERSLYGRT